MSQQKPQSSLRSVALVTGLTLFQLLVQFVLLRLLARWFGAGDEMDAYSAALAVPVVLATILASSLGYVLVPVFTEQRETQGDPAAARLTTQLGLYLLGMASLLAVIAAAAAATLARVLCPGFSPPQAALTAELLRILSLLIVANSLISFLNAEHHCWRQYALPAAAGVIGTLVSLGYVALLHARQGIHAVAWGLVAGAAITVVILSPRWLAQLLQRQAWQLRPQATVWKCGLLLWPLVLGAICWRFDPLLDRYLGSFLSTGSIAHLAYAGRLATALSILGISGLSIVAFPALAAHAAAARHDRVCAEFAAAWRLLLVLLVPLAAGLTLFSGPVARLLFQDGRFGPADTRAVAWLIICYLGMIVGTGLGDLLARTMYALQDTRTPVLASLLGFAVAVGLKLWLTPRLGAAGLAAATSACYVVHPALLGTILYRRLGRDLFAGTLGCLLRSGASAAVACGAAAVALHLAAPLGPSAVLLAAAAGAAVYAAGLWLLGDEFARRLAGWLAPRS